MKLFEERQLQQAYDHTKGGGQALHLFSEPGFYPGAPKCFKRSREAAHLFDYNIGRLIATAKRLGVRVIRIGHKGQRGQHIDLCGKPLQRAKEESSQSLI